MVRIGERVPHIRVPALVDGTLAYFEWERYRGRWLVLCCIPSLGLIDAIFLNYQYDAFAQHDAALVALCREDNPLHHPGIRQVGPLCVPILVDPLRRLHRTYGLPVQHRLGRCCTFLIDPNQVLRFQVLHDLNARGITAVLELLWAKQEQERPAFEQCKPEVPQVVSRL